MQAPALVYAVPGERRVLRALYPLISADAPTAWVMVAMEGTWEGHSRGSFKFTRDLFTQIAANYERNPQPVPLDYEHATEFAIPAPACGWVQGVEVRDGEGGAELWALVEFGDEAASFVRKGAYRFCSAVIDFDSIDLKTGEPIGAEMLSLALTNVPFIRGSKPIQLTRRAAFAAEETHSMNTFTRDALLRALKLIESDEISMEQLQAAAALASVAPGGGSAEEPAEEPAEMAADEAKDKPAEEDPEKKKDDPAAMSVALAAPPEEEEKPAAMAADADVGALLAAFMEQHGLTPEQVMGMLGGAAEPAAEAVLSRRQGETIAALNARVAAAETQLREYREREAKEAVDELVRSGRLLDTARAEMAALYLSNRKTFNAVTAGLPQVVPVGEHATALTPPTQETPAINEDDPEVRELRRWLKSAGITKAKQDERIRTTLAARRGDAARV